MSERASVRPSRVVGRALLGAIVLGQLVLLAVGSPYWLTAPARRAEHPLAPWLDPSSGGGQLLGLLGLGAMVVLLVYSVRKLGVRLGWSRGTGASLDVHVVAGIVGPLFILEHCGLQFGGMAGVAAIAMLVVVGSGIAGRAVRGAFLDRADQALARSEQPMNLLLRASVGADPDHPDQPDPRVVRSVALCGGLGAVPRDPVRLPLYELRLHRAQGAIQRLLADSPLDHRVRALLATEFSGNLAARRRLARARTFERLLTWWRPIHVAVAHVMYVLAALHALTALRYADTFGRIGSLFTG